MLYTWNASGKFVGPADWSGSGRLPNNSRVFAFGVAVNATKVMPVSAVRAVICRPSDNLFCGAADVSSNGFFDSNNVPPWDLWLGFLNGTLVSWVPPALVDVAAMGVFVNPEECIRWTDSHS
jgi:hypothetical protein